MQRNSILIPALFLLLSLFASNGAYAATPYNQWNGSGPFATGLGNRVVTAMAVSADGKTVYSGTGSGTLFSYEYKAPDAVTVGATNITDTGATLNGTVNANNADTTVSFEYGLTTSYGSSVAATPSTVTGTSATSVSSAISVLTTGAIYHYRVVATNAAGTSYGSDQSFSKIPLTITITISGTGSVTSQNQLGSNYSCNSAICDPMTFYADDTVTLTATGSNSTFSGWSGDYVSTSNPGSITMNTNKAVTASFAAAPNAKIGITGYATLADAYFAAMSGEIIKARSISFTEQLVLDQNKLVQIKGGYNPPYDCNICGENTLLEGTLTVKKGTVVIENLTIK